MKDNHLVEFEFKPRLDWQGKIAVAHHAKHHLYHTAIAYDQIGRLGRFYTQRYIPRPERLKWLSPILPASLSLKLRKILGYHHPQLEGKVTTHSSSWKHRLGSSLVGQSSFLNQSGDFEHAVGQECILQNWGCHSHVTGSLGIFRQLSAQNLPCLLEMYIGDKTLAKHFLSDELTALGLEASEHNLHAMGCSTQLAEKSREEIELADLIYCPSEFVINTMKEAGVPDHKLVYAPYGVDPGSCAVAPNKREQNQIFKVAFVGTEGVRKGLIYAIEAFRKLGPEFELHIFGLSDFKVPRLESIPENVVFHGFTSKAELLAELRTMHAGILVSLWEGSAIGAFDLLSQGLPMIVTLNSGTMVEDRVHGFTVPVRDPIAIVEALNSWYADDLLRQSMGQQAIQLTHHYNWGNYYAKTVEPLTQG
ncbi:MAG: glycosyltransferase family 4 protein [Fimbriimonadaceae bacterium]|nr:MAG: glycosyltransferase family 4 protein [Fimbriimonadaceae bacterium]